MKYTQKDNCLLNCPAHNNWRLGFLLNSKNSNNNQLYQNTFFFNKISYFIHNVHVIIFFIKQFFLINLFEIAVGCLKNI